jgi:epoxyqueuosine reductase
MMGLKEEIKEYAIDRLDMDYVGIASTDRLSGAPEGSRPTDILPGAKSVIVMAVRISKGAIQTIFRAHEDGLSQLLCIYGAHGYTLTPNFHLLFAAYGMARFLEKKGYMTTPLPSGPGQGGAPFSHRHAAVAAGLGEFGWLSILVTPDNGPRQRLVSVITRAELEPDPFYSGPKLCDPTKCDICVRVCPSQAISKTKSKTVVMGGHKFEYGEVNMAKCRISTEGLTTKTGGLKDIEIPENPTNEDVDRAHEQMDPRQKGAGVMVGNRVTYQCGYCFAYCPIGEFGWLKTVSNRKLK